nr:MAG TPA: hypothetical protein [Caudoviricetes sp.]
MKNKLTSAGQEGSRQAASVRRHEITAAAFAELIPRPVKTPTCRRKRQPLNSQTGEHHDHL